MDKLNKKQMVMIIFNLLILGVLVVTLFYGKNTDPCSSCKFDVEKFGLEKITCRDFATKIVNDCECFCDNQNSENSIVPLNKLI